MTANAPGHPLVKVGNKSAANTEAQRYYNSLESLGKNRMYAPYQYIIPELCNLASNPQFCLVDVVRIVSRLVPALFIEERYLSILMLPSS